MDIKILYRVDQHFFNVSQGNNSTFNVSQGNITALLMFLRVIIALFRVITTFNVSQDNTVCPENIVVRTLCICSDMFYTSYFLTNKISISC